MRKSDILFFIIILQLFSICLLALHAANEQEASLFRLMEKQELTRQFGLTDLCIVTEARYTRHPAVTDLHSAFQDAPMSFEHFPSGSFISPPLRWMREKHD